MTKRIVLALPCILIVVALLAAGCVTPPTGTSSSSNNAGYYSTQAGETQTTAPSSYVTEVTPFGTTSAPSAQGTSVNPYATSTPIAADQSCLIYLNKQYYFYNTTAITFDLKNPPMYINYTVVPFNITVNKFATSKSGSKQDVTYTYSDYAPYSWFQITVRDKTSGKILLQDGFGRQQGYGIYTNATLKPILNSGEVQVEMYGNNITATTGVWVKPVGNFDDPQNKTFAECKYWGATRNTMLIQTPTTTPTWTPENQVSISVNAG